LMLVLRKKAELDKKGRVVSRGVLRHVVKRGDEKAGIDKFGSCSKRRMIGVLVASNVSP